MGHGRPNLHHLAQSKRQGIVGRDGRGRYFFLAQNQCQSGGGHFVLIELNVKHFHQCGIAEPIFEGKLHTTRHVF